MRWFASLRRQADFARVRRHGRRAGLPTMHAFALERRAGAPRIGVTVPGTVGNAVVRNLLRRRVQGALAALPGARPADVVFIVNAEAASASFSTLAGDVAEGLRRVLAPASSRRPPA